MVKADVIVLATPVYFYTMSAQMKTLIDRSCARYTEISNKDFYFIATMAETEANRIERTFESLRGFTDSLEGPREKGTIAAIGVWQKGEVNDKPYMQQAYEMGKAILKLFYPALIGMQNYFLTFVQIQPQVVLF